MRITTSPLDYGLRHPRYRAEIYRCVHRGTWRVAALFADAALLVNVPHICPGRTLGVLPGSVSYHTILLQFVELEWEYSCRLELESCRCDLKT